MVNLVYFTGGWLTQFTPTIEEEVELVQEGMARLVVAAGIELLVGECRDVAAAVAAKLPVDEPLLDEEEVCCLPIRMFSTVKLDTSLAGGFEVVEAPPQVLGGTCSTDFLSNSTAFSLIL